MKVSEFIKHLQEEKENLEIQFSEFSNDGDECNDFVPDGIEGEVDGVLVVWIKKK